MTDQTHNPRANPGNDVTEEGGVYASISAQKQSGPYHIPELTQPLWTGSEPLDQEATQTRASQLLSHFTQEQREWQRNEHSRCFGGEVISLKPSAVCCGSPPTTTEAPSDSICTALPTATYPAAFPIASNNAFPIAATDDGAHSSGKAAVLKHYAVRCIQAFWPPWSRHTKKIHGTNPFSWLIIYEASFPSGVEGEMITKTCTRRAVAVLDPRTPCNVISRQFANKIYSHSSYFDSIQATAPFETITGQPVMVFGRVNARWWIEDNTWVHPRFVESDFYIMKEHAPFEIIIGLADILRYELLVPNRSLIMWHGFRSPPPRNDDNAASIVQAEANLRRQREAEEMRRAEQLRQQRQQAEDYATRRAQYAAHVYAEHHAGASSGPSYNAVYYSLHCQQTYRQAWEHAQRDYLAGAQANS